MQGSRYHTCNTTGNRDERIGVQAVKIDGATRMFVSEGSQTEFSAYRVGHQDLLHTQADAYGRGKSVAGVRFVTIRGNGSGGIRHAFQGSANCTAEMMSAIHSQFTVCVEYTFTGDSRKPRVAIAKEIFAAVRTTSGIISKNSFVG